MFFSDYPMMRKIDLLLWSMGRKIEKEDGQKMTLIVVGLLR